MAAAGNHSPERGHAHAPAMVRHCPWPLLESPFNGGWVAGGAHPPRAKPPALHPEVVPDDGIRAIVLHPPWISFERLRERAPVR